MLIVWILLLVASACPQDPETTTARQFTANVTILYPTNKTLTRFISDTKPLKNTHPQTWQFDAALVESNLTEADDRNNSPNIEEKANKEVVEDFKPSEHLGSFFDEDSAEVIKTPIAAPVHKDSTSAIVNSVKDNHLGNYQPKLGEIYHTHKEFPYHYEDAAVTKIKHWRDESLDSKPTVEAPFTIPAGGLYKSPDAFKDKPNSDEKIGLGVINEEEKEIIIKRRMNPWKDLLRLITAFIPAGLIISALTPSVITIHNVDNKRETTGTLRRADSAVKTLSPISEQCRRRLLCELRSDRYYTSASSPARRITKLCYKIHCEDTEAVWRVLRWLFTYNQAEDDHRRTHLT